MIKKWLYIFIVLICVLCISSCKKDNGSNDSNNGNNNNTPVVCVHDIQLYEENKYKCTKCNVEFRSIYFENVDKFQEEKNKVEYNKELNQYYIIEDANVIMYDETKEQYYMYDIYNECPTIPDPVRGNLEFLYWEIVEINGVRLEETDEFDPESDRVFDPKKDKLTDNLVLRAIFVGDIEDYPIPIPNPNGTSVLEWTYNNASFTVNVSSKDVQKVSEMLPGLGQGEVIINVPPMTFKVLGDKLYFISGEGAEKLETYVEFIKENNEVTAAKVSMTYNGTSFGENTVTDPTQIEVYKNALHGNFIYFNDTLFTNVLENGTTHGNEVLLKEILLEEYKEQPGEDYELKKLDINVYDIVAEDGKPVKYELDYVADFECTYLYTEDHEVTIYITKYYNATITFTNVGVTVIE